MLKLRFMMELHVISNCLLALTCRASAGFGNFAEAPAVSSGLFLLLAGDS